MMSGYPKSKTKENLERTGLRDKGKDDSMNSEFTVPKGTKKSSLRLQGKVS